MPVYAGTWEAIYVVSSELAANILESLGVKS